MLFLNMNTSIPYEIPVVIGLAGIIKESAMAIAAECCRFFA